jgi:hypothetical protein
MSSQTIVVIVSKPLWIQMETSINKGDYLIISNFKADKNTTCTIDGVQIDPKLAIEGALYGNYQCRIYHSSNENIVKKRTIFKQGNAVFPTALLVSGALVSALLLLGK